MLLADIISFSSGSCAISMCTDLDITVATTEAAFFCLIAAISRSTCFNQRFGRSVSNTFVGSALLEIGTSIHYTTRDFTAMICTKATGSSFLATITMLAVFSGCNFDIVDYMLSTLYMKCFRPEKNHIDHSEESEGSHGVII